MNKLRLLSGIQPTGKIHIGNYLGAVQNWLGLQDQYECLFPIVDMHSLSGNFDPKEKSQQIWQSAAELLAAGINPDKSALFIQSRLPQHAELAWYLSVITPVGDLERMTQFKDKSGRQTSNINAGLLTYPILMAADILLYKPQAVPVGDDQLQHLELTNQLARKFNIRFGKTFDPVKPLLTQTPRVMSILEPDKKMSKSLGDKHVINLSDEPEMIAKKLSRAVTDAGNEKTMSRGSKNLFDLLQSFGESEQYEYYLEARKNGTIKYAEFKANLAKTIAHHFSAFRKNLANLQKNPSIVDQAIQKGEEKARILGSSTLAEVKQKMGLI